MITRIIARGLPGRATLTITRGLPGSGKTTWARQQRDAVRVNRDDLRAMLLPAWPYGDRITLAVAESACTAAQHASIDALLNLGRSVICDDTNMSRAHVAELAAIARRHGARFQVQDFTDVPLETCIARDATRARPVGEAVIRRMHERHLASDRERENQCE